MPMLAGSAEYRLAGSEGWDTRLAEIRPGNIWHRQRAEANHQ